METAIIILQRILAAKILAKRAVAQFVEGAKQKHTDDYGVALVDMLCDQLQQGETAIKQLMADKVNRRVNGARAAAAKCADDCDKAAWQSAQLKAGGKG